MIYIGMGNVGFAMVWETFDLHWYGKHQIFNGMGNV